MFRGSLARTTVALLTLVLMCAACAGSNSDANDDRAAVEATATPGPTPTATPQAAPTALATLTPATATTDVDREPTESAEPAEPAEATAVPSADQEFGAVAIADPASRATLEGSACRFDIPPGTAPACYTLTVPENWSDPSAERMIRLPLAVFAASDSSTATDPVIYLEGGPGGHALELLGFSFAGFFSELNRTRDLVVFDQRGSGFAAPRLTCREVDALLRAGPVTIKDPIEEEAEFVAAVRDCSTRLADQDIDISQYNSVASAADMEAMRQLLGYEPWNLLGISYGTRLAQTSMRLYPEGIRSVVLDSVVPVSDDRPAVYAPHAAQALERLFDACADDAGCAARHPNFEADFFATVDAWDATPVSFAGTDPLTGEVHDFLFDGSDLLSLAFGTLYSRASLAVLPQVIEEAQANRFTVISSLAALDIAEQEYLTAGMFIAVYCAEEIPFSVEDDLERSIPDNPYYARFADSINGAFFFDLCTEWGATAVSDIENDVVTSDLPTLLMGGRFDPITPSSALEDVTAGLSTAWSVEFPHEGHGVSPTPCGLEIVLTFLDNPDDEPDTSCVANAPSPAWTTNPNQPITLVDFEVDVAAASARSVRPREWVDQGNGVFARDNTIADPALLLVQNTFGLGAETVLAFFAEPLGWDSLPELSETRTVNGRDWEIHRGDVGASTAIAAVGDDGRDAMIVLVVGDPTDFPRFVDEVFEPALAAVEPV